MQQAHKSRTAFWAAWMLAIAMTGAVHAAVNPAIRPGADGPVSAALLPDGLVQLENEHLRVVLDPADNAGGRSIIHKASGKELATCVTYNEKHFKAFREAIPGMFMGESRIEPEGRPYELKRLEAKDGRATATFAGLVFAPGTPKSRLEPPEEVENPEELYSRVRIVKTYELAAGESRLRVTVEAVNDNKVVLPIGLWLLNGLRIEGEDVLVFGPAPRGTMEKQDLWTQKGSAFVTIPRPAAPWTGMAAKSAPNLALYVAGQADQIDTVYDWLAKYVGTCLTLGTALYDIKPGASLKVPYSLIAAQGLSRIDGASPDLACGIRMDAAKAQAGKPLAVTLEFAAPRACEATVALSLQRVTEAGAKPAGEKTVRLAAGQAATETFEITPPAEGVYAVIATLKTAEGQTLRAARPLELGAGGEVYRAELPQLSGKPWYSAQLGEKPLPAWMRVLDRTVQYPMVPWNAPALKPAKVLFACEVDWTIGSLRELARRAGCEWDLTPLYGKETYGSGTYREMEQEELQKKAEALKPDCLFSAGIRYEALDPAVEAWLLARVNEGMGLVAVGCESKGYSAWPPKFLKRAGMNKTADNINRAIGSVWDGALFAQGNAGTVACYEYGKGRIVVITKNLSPTRDGLLPGLSTQTDVPEEEYHFGQYIRAIRHVTREPQPVRIQNLAGNGTEIVVEYESAGKLPATLVYSIVSADLLSGKSDSSAVTLVSGKGTLNARIPALPGGSYVLNAWLLDGTPKADTNAEDHHLLYRAPFGAPVLDFAAAPVTMASAASVQKIAFQGKPGAVPEGISVTVAAGKDAAADRLTVAAEIHNGEDGRIVWRGSAPCATNGVATFGNIRYEPVAAKSRCVARVLDNGQEIARASQKFDSKPPFIDPAQANFLTSAGIHESLFAFRVCHRWATEEIGIDFTQPGSLPNAFPWKRKNDKTTEPSMADLEVFRAAMTNYFPKARVNCAYLQDEFKLGDEYDYSAGTLAAFAGHLETVYKTVAALNAAWGADYKTFAEAQPILLKELKAGGARPARWLDFRLFMDTFIAARYRIAAEEAAKVSPDLRIGASGAYEPGCLIGDNFYEMSRHSRFMASYPGLRAEWVRAFAPEDALIQIWVGYGGSNPRNPWKALFDGYNGVSWWGYLPSSGIDSKGILVGMGMVGVDLTPKGTFREVGRQQLELQRGIGMLMINARREEPSCYLPYSQASAYVANIYERNHATAVGNATAFLANTLRMYSFVADEEAAAGRLEKMKGKLFVLPGSDALPLPAAEAYARSVDAGGFLIADAESGTRDGHGNPQADLPLDKLLGLRRSAAEAKPAADPEPVTWSADAPEALRALAGATLARAPGKAEVATGRAWGVFADGTPAVVARATAGGGLAVWLNTRFEWMNNAAIAKAFSGEPSAKAPETAVAAILRHVLEQAKIGTPVRVEPAAMKPASMVSFANKDARYYGLLLGKEAGAATITFPRKAHTYDARAGLYLGETDSVPAKFDPAECAKFYAQLPYRVEAIEAAPDAPRKKGGANLRVAGALRASGAVSADHVIHIELVKPDGSRPLYYRRNVLAPAGRFAASFPLPLNAEPGAWKAELRDAATGVAASAAFEVEASGN